MTLDGRSTEIPDGKKTKVHTIVGDYLMDEKEQAVKFLEADFNQCFQHMRYYDSQMFDAVKFFSTAYVALIGIGVGLYQFGCKEDRDFTLAVIISFLLAFFLGLFIYMLIVRNRVYYVHVARYINEIRATFLKHKPLGFENVAGMYKNHGQPQFFNWRSSQAYLMYVITTINALLIGVVVFILSCGTCCPWCYVLLVFSIIAAVQLISGICYLKSREGKSASKSVFGKE